jgi:hypothetical protein
MKSRRTRLDPMTIVSMSLSWRTSGWNLLVSSTISAGGDAERQRRYQEAAGEQQAEPDPLGHHLPPASEPGRRSGPVQDKQTVAGRHQDRRFVTPAPSAPP